MALSLCLHAAARADSFCPGDCDGDGEVSVDEVVVSVPLLFGDSFGACPAADVDLNGTVAVAEVLRGLQSAIDGCPPASDACNGSVDHCGRRYDQVAYATTHNAMANAQDGFRSPNQAYNLPTQLFDGVRAFMLDTYEYEGQVQLCHADCAFFGHRPLADALVELREFLDTHPREVVTIIFEAYASAEATEQVFIDTGLIDYAYVQPAGEPWPTLEEMIAANQRLVVFTDRDRGALPWYLYVWDYAFETPFSFEKPSDLSCNPNRGSPDNSLFILNHFLTRGVGHPNLAKQINFNPLFRERALECGAANDRLPNFVTVDFYDIGDVLNVVTELNGLPLRP